MKQFFTTLLFSCLTLFLFAQGPRISVQGTLKDANGVTVDDGTYELTFRLYPVAEGGTAVFEEVGEVSVQQGIYSYLLGSVNTLNPSIFGVTLFLGITVNDVELTPRGELTYAPYSMAVNTATYADTAKYVLGGDRCKGAIGDIKYSILPLSQFQSVNGDCWVEMDGASLPVGNPLRTLTTVDTIPDARGVFLRANDNRTTASAERQDPDRDENTAIGTLQADENKAHKHKTPDYYLDAWQSNDAKGLAAGSSRTLFVNPNSSRLNQDTGVDVGGEEARPKNLNFYLYIRIE